MTDPERAESDGRPHNIESQGVVYAEKLRGRMESGEERFSPYVELKYEDVFRFPRLAIGSDLRFDPITGAIYTTRWTKLKTFEDPATGRWSIEHPEIIFLFPDGPSCPARKICLGVEEQSD